MAIFSKEFSAEFDSLTYFSSEFSNEFSNSLTYFTDEFSDEFMNLSTYFSNEYSDEFYTLDVPALPSEYNEISSGGAKVSGLSKVVLKGYYIPFLPSGGGVAISGEANCKVSYKGSSSGGINIDNEHEADAFMSIYTDLTVLWDTKKLYVVDTDFLWDTSPTTQTWYRIVSITEEKCKPSDCDCVQLITNIHATSLGNLCEKLTARGWKWPIKSVEKWSSDHCTLETVDVCTHPLCAEFCLDADVTINAGFSMSVTTLVSYFCKPLGGLSISGNADVKWDNGFVTFDYKATGGIEISPVGADYYNSSFFAVGSGGKTISGSAGVSCSNWSFVGCQWPNFEKYYPRSTTTMLSLQALESQVNWQNTDNVKSLDGQPAEVDLSYGGYSDFLVAKNFGFDLPEDSRILGIEVKVNRVATMSVKDKEVYLIQGEEFVSDNMAKSFYWPYIYTDTSYGSASDDWRDNTREGFGNWTAEEINSDDFGVAIRVASMGSIADTFARIDSISVNVCYESTTHQQFITVGGNCYWVAKESHYTATGSFSISGTASATYNVKYRYKIPNDNVIHIGGFCGNNFYYTNTSGGITLSGEAFCKPSWQQITASGGVKLGGAGSLETWWTGSGYVSISGTANVSVKYHYVPFNPLVLVGRIRNYEFSEDFSNDYAKGQELSQEKIILGTGAFSSGFSNGFYTYAFIPALAKVNYNYIPSGGINISGFADVSSPNYHWYSSGNVVFVSGSADTNYRGLGMHYTTMHGDMKIKNFSATLSDVGTPSTMPTLTGIVRECGCTKIPLLVNLKQNIGSNNKLSQFLTRTGQAFPTVIPMLYNKTNDVWQANYHFDGWSLEHSGAIEIWNVLFELSCTGSIGTVDTGQSLWSFSTQIVRKETTGSHRMTKVMVAVAPTSICKANVLNYYFRYNTSLNSVTVSPNSVLYQKFIYDNIGLFKNQYWKNNPIFEVSISQGIMQKYIPESTTTTSLGYSPVELMET